MLPCNDITELLVVITVSLHPLLQRACITWNLPNFQLKSHFSEKWLKRTVISSWQRLPLTTLFTSYHLFEEPGGSSLTPNYPLQCGWKRKPNKLELKNTRIPPCSLKKHCGVSKNQGSRKSPPMYVLNKTCSLACIFQRAARISPHSSDS